VTTCQVVLHDDFLPNIASIPPDVWRDAGLGAATNRDVRLRSAKKTTYLTALPREGAAGRQVWVGPGILGLAAGAVNNCDIETVAPKSVRRHLLFGTWNGRLALLGLALASAGILIQTYNALGDGGPFGDIGKPQRALMSAIALGLQLIGLVLVFWRGLWRRTLP